MKREELISIKKLSYAPQVSSSERAKQDRAKVNKMKRLNKNKFSKYLVDEKCTIYADTLEKLLSMEQSILNRKKY